MESTIKREVSLLLQFGFISLLAAGYAFDTWLGPVGECQCEAEVWMMIEAWWKHFFRWWLLAFTCLAVVRLALLFLFAGFASEREGNSGT